MKKAIYSKNVLLPSGMSEATIVIEDGTIVSVSEGKLPDTPALKVKNLGVSVIMPGLIDCHVHINEPGRTEWEGFETATMAAGAGGVTSLVDMPLNSSPVTTSVKALNEKIKATEGKLYVDCGFWGGIVPGNFDQIEPLLKAGVQGFKVFLTHSGIDDFPATTLKELEKAAPLLAKYNVPLLAHAELDKPHKGQKELEADNYSYLAWLHSRPKSWEGEAIKGLIALTEKFGTRVHIVHLSSADALNMIRKARTKGDKLTVETCPHYLYFEAEKIHDSDTRFKCAPPIREAENNMKLWEALVDGTLDFIVTDHSPAPPDLKELDTGNFKEAWGGISSLQFSLPVVWTLAQKRNIPLEQVSKWMSTNIADFLGWKNKGRIAEGADADFVIWSPQKKINVSRNLIRFRHKVTPYEGEHLSGLIEETWVGGVPVYDRGAFIAEPPGKTILRTL